MNMKISKTSLTLTVLQFLTLAFILVSLPLYSSWFEFGFKRAFAMSLILYIFFPNLLGWIHKIPYDEIKYLIMIILAFTWLFLLYNISRIAEYMFKKYFGIYVYFVSLIPVVVLILYLTYYKEWRNLYKSLTHLYIEDYIKKEAEERVKEIKLEFGEIPEQ